MAYAFGDFELEVASLELRERGVVLAAQPKTLAVLVYLVRNRDRVVSHEELLDAVWPGITVGPNSLAQAIASIRRLLHDSDDATIRTIRSRGYRFVAPVEQRRDLVACTAASELPFVGRAATLERLLERLAEARSGQGGIVLVTGAPGIGKTRTVDELSRVSEARGQSVLRARCYEDGEAYPLSLWRDLTRSFAPRQGFGDVEPLSLDTALEGEPFHAFEAIGRWLERIARSQPPLLIVLDDLNWADSPSLLLLKYLDRNIHTLPLLIVATYRDAPIEPTLARVLGALCREHPSRRMELGALDLGATTELANRLAGRPLSSELVGYVWQKADGNPLFLTQMLHVLAMEDIHEPVTKLTSTILASQTVREAIAAHLERLSDQCRDVLSAAAVIGPELSLDWLVHALRVEPEVVMRSLDEACSARIIERSPGELNRFRFRHGIVRDVLYRQLSLVEKTRRHWAAAQALGRLYEEDRPVDPCLVADHWVRGVAAGDALEAARWLIRASKSSWEAESSDRALVLLERVLELTLPLGDTASGISEEAIEQLTQWSKSDATGARAEGILERFRRRKLGEDERRKSLVF